MSHLSLPIRFLARSPMALGLGLVAGLLLFAVNGGPVQAHDIPNPGCVETVNPHGENVPPAGSTTLPGPKGGQNDDGFYKLVAPSGNFTPPLQMFVVDLGTDTVFGPYAVGTNVKYTEANGKDPTEKKIGSTNGQAGAVLVHIQGQGDMGVFAVDANGLGSETISCLVPPPPK